MVSTIGRQAGFSLIEVLAALAILALVAVVAPPYVKNAMARAEAEGAVDRIVAALAEAHDLAVTRNRAVRVVIDESAVSVEGGRWRKLPGGIALTVSSERAVMFRPDGSSSGGQVVVSSPGRALLLTIDPLTGRVRRVHAGGG